MSNFFTLIAQNNQESSDEVALADAEPPFSSETVQLPSEIPEKSEKMELNDGDGVNNNNEVRNFEDPALWPSATA